MDEDASSARGRACHTGPATDTQTCAVPHEWIFSSLRIRVFTIDVSNVLKADAISPKFEARRSKENYTHDQVHRTPTRRQ